VSEWVRAWHRWRRQNRFLLAAFVVLMTLSVGAFYLLQRTQAASPRELTNRLLLFVLWYLDVSLIGVLLFILLRNLIRLGLEQRAGVLGSRFRTKLVLTYVGLTFLPVIFLFLIATNLLQRSIDRWFSAPVEEVLRGGAAVTVQLRELAEDRLRRQASVAADELLAHHGTDRLTELQALLGVDVIAFYQGQRLVHAIADPRRIPRSLPPLPPGELLAPGSRSDRWRGGLLVRAWSPVGTDGGTVVVGDLLPREVLVHLERATAAEATFQEMKLERGAITSTTILVFLAITLLLLFATVWVGLYLSRRFTEPLLAVAAATQRVAEGNQLEEVAIPASDEVAALVNSFNAMVRRVRSTEREILASNQELATLLATIPTGILTLAADGGRFRPNPAAARLLGGPIEAGQWRPLADLPEAVLATITGHLHEGAGTAAPVEVGLEVEGTIRHVEVTVRPLAGGGHVVAMDDLTQLVRAQRQAAWSEVARRIAHEIKNPLTPIRLAAERIQRRTSGLDGELREVVGEGCAAIIAQVADLKALVDAFHEYARMPAVSPRGADVGQLLQDVVALYGDLRDGLDINLERPTGSLAAVVDPTLLRLALVNLLDNAVEALPDGGRIVVRAAVDHRALVIEVEDDGVGLPTDDATLLVQPFYSTKGRGSGMGLALVQRIVVDHGGSLELERRLSQGTRARIVLPGALIGDPGTECGAAVR